MPSQIRLRRVFKPLINLLARGSSKVGLSPNGATIIMLLCSIISFFCLVYLKSYLWFGIMVFITGIFDGIDGALARLNKRITKYGGFFDSLMDRLSEFTILLALLINRWNQSLWFIIDMRFIVFSSLFISIMISYSRSRAQAFHKGDYDIGLMARSERLFYIFIISLLSVFIGFLNEFLFVFLLLVILTALYRGIKIHRIIKLAETKAQL
jgi:archaetidylinositol phosphate synthase